MLLSQTCLVLETLVNFHGCWNCNGPIGLFFWPLEEKLQVEICFERLGWIFWVAQDFVFEGIPLNYYFQLPKAILFLSFRQEFSSGSWLPKFKKNRVISVISNLSRFLKTCLVHLFHLVPENQEIFFTLLKGIDYVCFLEFMYVEKTFDLSSKVEKGPFNVWFHVIGNLTSLDVLFATIKAFPIAIAYAILAENVETILKY